jgi:O-succinylbenzoic acid--CoA ligase
MLDINTDWLYQQRLSTGKKIVSAEEALSYKELNVLADNYCALLKKSGVKKNDNVALLSGNNSDFIAAIFGIWRAGAVAVPLNTKLTVNEIKDILAASDSKCAILQNGIILKDELTNPNIKIIEMPLVEELSAPINSDYHISPEQTALIMYTSGSSGAPKGVELTFSNLYYSAANANEVLEHTGKDRWLASLPFYHIGGFSIIIRTMLYGTSIIFPSSMNYMNIVESIQKHHPSLISLVPTNLKRMLESGVRPNKELRYVLLGGGPSEKDLVDKALNEGWNIIKVYGSTETSSLVSAVDCRKHISKSGSSGKALSGNEILITDDNFSALENNVAGNIGAAGPSIFDGYYKDDQYTKSKFNGKYYLTGDYGYIDKDGFLYVLSRRTDLIISGGENISPFEIEEKLNALENIIESCVFPADDKEWGQIAAAAIVVKKNFQGVENAIREELKQMLPSFKIPKKFFIVKEIPKTSIGKPKREEIKKLFTGADAL